MREPSEGRAHWHSEGPRLASCQPSVCWVAQDAEVVADMFCGQSTTNAGLRVRSPIWSTNSAGKRKDARGELIDPGLQFRNRGSQFL